MDSQVELHLRQLIFGRLADIPGASVAAMLKVKQMFDLFQGSRLTALS
jgi:hypothetical protein